MANYKKQSTKTEEIHDGYCVVSLKKSFVKKIKKDFEKESNADYKAFKKYMDLDNGIPVIPPTFNARRAKYRMKIESAIENDQLVAVQVTETNKFKLDESDYLKLESKLLSSDADVVSFNNKGEILFLCSNDEQNLETVTDIIYSEIINKREYSGIGLVKKDGFLNKELEPEEQKFVEKMVMREISQGLYIGDQALALNLLSKDSHFVKLILQEKHRKDIEKILMFLKTSYINFNDSLFINKRDINDINKTIDDYVHGAIFIKDKEIFGLDAREEAKNEMRENLQENETQRIEDIINKNITKNKEQERDQEKTLDEIIK